MLWGMELRVLTPSDYGVLLQVFAVLLIFFGIDFHLSRRMALEHRLQAYTLTVLSVVGELATAVALGVTWFALYAVDEKQSVDTWLVFIPGSFAMAIAVFLTVAKAIARQISASEQSRRAREDAKRSGITEAEIDAADGRGPKKHGHKKHGHENAGSGKEDLSYEGVSDQPPKLTSL